MVLTYHCATYSVWPSLLLIVLYLALTAKPFETPALDIVEYFMLKKDKFNFIESRKFIYLYLFDVAIDVVFLHQQC